MCVCVLVCVCVCVRVCVRLRERERVCVCVCVCVFHRGAHNATHVLVLISHFETHPTPQVRDWYVESFRELRAFPGIKGGDDEAQFTDLLRHIYRRHVRRGVGRWGGTGGGGGAGGGAGGHGGGGGVDRSAARCTAATQRLQAAGGMDRVGKGMMDVPALSGEATTRRGSQTCCATSTAAT